MQSKLVDILWCAEPMQRQVNNIEEESLEQQRHGPAGEQGVDSLSGNIADIIAADITAHRRIDQQNKVGDTAENDITEKIDLFENKGEEIKVKDRKEQHQGKSFMKPAFQADLEKIQSTFQGEKLSRDVLSFAFDDIKLLYFGDGIQEIFWFIYPAAVGCNNLGIGIILPFILPFSAHLHSSSDRVSSIEGLTLMISRSICGLACSITAMEPKASA